MLINICLDLNCAVLQHTALCLVRLGVVADARRMEAEAVMSTTGAQDLILKTRVLPFGTHSVNNVLLMRYIIYIPRYNLVSQ